MKITFNWLKQYVDFDWSAEQLTERLTMLGLEVESATKLGGEFEGVVVAQILASDKHPNADKLSVCRVADGTGERQIVCGAKNYKVGDKVPLILPGHSLPAKPGEQPFVIKVGKLRGVESQGMMCSPRELGLSDDAEGLLILPSDAKVGQKFSEHLGRATGDVVYDLEVTPNRPDWDSVIGIAREISALTGNSLRLPELKADRNTGAGSGSAEKIDAMVSVQIEDAELCPRYTARVIRGVKVGPSPDWLRATLEKIGLRSINNVVDVTNYVMLEIGQPLHAFDYHLLTAADGKRPAIVVRRARDQEKFVTLDNQPRMLNQEMLVIADETKAIALAGVMGGQNSEIKDSTRDVLIESAYFKPQTVRATARKLGLKTDASYRFERGADIGICDWASRRAARLILETAGGELVDGVADAYPTVAAPRNISLRFERTNSLLGIEIPAAQQTKFLTSLDLELAESSRTDGATAEFRIPTFRVDLKREADLIEEIARLYGVEKIPSTPPRGVVGSNEFDFGHDEIAEARRILTALGLNEAQGQTLISDIAAKNLAPEGALVSLANPLSSEMNVLRPSLLPGLLDSLRHNLARKNHDVALFEIGRVFVQTSNRPREERRLAVAMTGRRSAPFWSGAEREATLDAYDLKGILEEFFEQFGARGLTYSRRGESTSFFLESAVIALGKQNLGDLGQLQPALARRHDLRDAVLLAELNLDLILARRNAAKSFKTLPAFPAIRRDIAMFVPDATTHEAVLSVVRQAKVPLLESVELFDVFRGKNIPTGQKSVAYAFTYRGADRTLPDAEINAAHEKLTQELKAKLGAEIRA